MNTLLTKVVIPAALAAAACGNDRTSKGDSNAAPDAGMTADASDDDASGGTVTGPLPAESLEVCTAGWCWVNPKPYGSTLHAVHGAGGAVFLVGSGGTILQQIDGRWSAHVATDTHLYDVFAVRSDLAFAAGPALDQPGAGHVYQWDGSSWERVHTTEPQTGANVVGPLITPTGIWASETVAYVGLGDQIYRRTGEQWEELDTPGGGVLVGDIECSDDSCYAVGQTTSHLRFAEAGFIWRLQGDAFVDESVDVGALTTITARPDGSFLAAGVAGASSVTAVTDGDNWVVAADAPGAVADLVVSTDGREWVASTTFQFWNVHVGSTTEGWTDLALPFQRPASLGPGRSLPGLYASADDLYFVGRSDILAGEIARYRNEAWETFTPIATPSGGFHDIAASDELIAVASETAVYLWEPGGAVTTVDGAAEQVWVTGDRAFAIGRSIDEIALDGSRNPLSGTPDSVDAFFGLSPDTMFAGANWAIHNFDGSTWTAHDFPDEAYTAVAFWARAPDDAYALVNAGVTVPLLWHFDGAQWAPIEESPTDNPDEDWILTGNDSGVLVVDPNPGSSVAFSYDGTTMTDLPRAPGALTDVLGLPDGDFIATTQSGAVLRLSGGAWTREPQLVEGSLDTVAATSSGKIWVAGVSSTILRFTP